MDAEAYILAGSPAMELRVIREAVAQLEFGFVKFSSIVASINDYILSDNAIHQIKALEYMAALLATMPSDALSRHDISLMTSYYLARLAILSAPGLKQTVSGLRALANMTRFDGSCANDVCATIFSRETFESESSDSRVEVYLLLQTLLDKHKSSLMMMGDELILGMTTIASQERNPRSLYIIFSSIRTVLGSWNIRSCVQQLWEYIAQYYPISYYLKPGDPTDITPEQLKGKLRLCIAATPEFSTLAFEFLLSKLDTQVSADVKNDVLKTLGDCISAYKKEDVAKYAVKLWDSLKYEVLNSVDEDVACEACLVLGKISRTLSLDLTVQTIWGTPFMAFIFAVIEECNRKIQDSQLRNVKQAMEILFHVTSSSPFAFNLVLKGVLPSVQTVIGGTDSMNRKKELLKVIHRLLDARIVLVNCQYESGFPALSIIDGISESVPENVIGWGSLSFFRDELFETFAVSLGRTPREETSLRTVALQGLVKLVMLPSLLAAGEVGMIVQQLTDLVLDREEWGDELREHAIIGLRDIGWHYPQHIADMVFSALLSVVPDELSGEENAETYFPILRALAKITSPIRMLYELFNRRLLDKLDVVILRGRSQKLAYTVLSALLVGIKQSVFHRGEKHTCDARDTLLYQGLVEALYRRVTCLLTRDEGPLAGQKYVGIQMLKMKGPETPAVPEEHKEIGELGVSVDASVEERARPSGGYSLVEPDDFMLELIGNIALVATRAMTLEDQTWASREIFTLFMRTDSFVEKHSECSISESGGDTSEMIEIFYDSDTELRHVQTSLADAPLSQKRTLLLSMHLMCGLRPNSKINIDTPKLCTELIRCVHASYDSHRSILAAGILMICFLVNKFDCTNATTETTDERTMPQHVLKDLVTHASLMPLPEAKNVLHMAVLVTRALNMRGCRSTAEFLGLLMDHLGHPTLGLYLAKEFEHLLGPHEHINESNFLVVRPIYRQRPYAVCFPQLSTAFRSCADRSVRANYLVALANILKYTPSESIIADAGKILPIMLQSISAIGTGVKTASIQVIHEIIVKAPNAAEEHIWSIIRQLLERIHNTLEDPSDAPSRVRNLALSCLADIPKWLPNRVTFPHRLEVLRELKIAADDVKRSVREETVPCYTAWFYIRDPDAASES